MKSLILKSFLRGWWTQAKTLCTPHSQLSILCASVWLSASALLAPPSSYGQSATTAPSPKKVDAPASSSTTIGSHQGGAAVTRTGPEVLPGGLQRLSARPGRPPVLLVSGLFLSPSVFLHGPKGGLAKYLEQQGFEVWLWNPWTSGARSLSGLSEAALRVAATVTERNRLPVRWVGMETGALIGLLAAGNGASLTGVAGIGPRLDFSSCFSPLMQRLTLAAQGETGEQASLLSSLWSWGDVPTSELETALLSDQAPLPPDIARELLALCEASSQAQMPGPVWERLWLPTAFFVSPRDGQAPIELALDHFDQAPGEFRSVRVSKSWPPPSHLGLLLGRSAVRDTYQPLARWLKRLEPDRQVHLPLVPAEIRSAGKGDNR